MKRAKIQMLALAVLVYSGAALAQHGHGAGGGPGGGMGHGSSMGHDMGAPSHGHQDGKSSSAHPTTAGGPMKINPTIAGKIEKLTGMPAQQACQGFKNVGQCVAAAHVSKNLRIPFGCLRADMTGTAPLDPTQCPEGTGSSKMSLGKSIQTLHPTANHSSEAKKGQKQADQDLKDSKSSS
jgi:hypothetical protein